MDPESRRLTQKYSTFTAITGFVTYPIPGLNELVVIPAHYWFVVLLTRRRGQLARRAPWWQLQKIIWGGAGVRVTASLTLRLIPMAGAFSNAVTSAAVTEVLAEYLDEALNDPERPPPEVSMRSLRDAIARKIKEIRRKKTEAPMG